MSSNSKVDISPAISSFILAGIEEEELGGTLEFLTGQKGLNALKGLSGDIARKLFHVKDDIRASLVAEFEFLVFDPLPEEQQGDLGFVEDGVLALVLVAALDLPHVFLKKGVVHLFLQPGQVLHIIAAPMSLEMLN